MSGRLEGKVCVITGAAGGIGSATTARFEREGARVVGVDVREHGVGELSLTADLTIEDEVRALYARVARRAGPHRRAVQQRRHLPADDASVLDTDLDVWERVQATNLRSVFLCCKHGIPQLLRRAADRGSVINTASFVAVMGSATSQIAYTASKGGVLALSRELGVEFAKRGVRVNALCPGPVDTPLLRELYAADPVQAARRMVHVPMGRFAQAEEIANAVLFLACDESSYVNATDFLVDGGISGGLHDTRLRGRSGSVPGRWRDAVQARLSASGCRARDQPVSAAGSAGAAARARPAADAPGARAATSSSARTATPPRARAARGSPWRRAGSRRPDRWRTP